MGYSSCGNPYYFSLSFSRSFSQRFSQGTETSAETPTETRYRNKCQKGQTSKQARGTANIIKYVFKIKKNLTEFHPPKRGFCLLFHCKDILMVRYSATGEKKKRL